ncbi:MAG: aminoacyl-histidine dipeptidase [Chitinophagaceae bacterium]|nr:aminoacyl-histidine dipeptidase [Chitinophagaceae bacterium]
MNDTIKQLQPTELWRHFADLNAVPRPSKKEERVIAFIKAFGEGLGLPTVVDKVGNIIIKKPASSGMEDRQTVVLQSHIDMVHQKNSDTVFDFDTQGIEMYIDGDWVKAKGTTLGADNGIGVAAIMSILSSTDIVHPPIEALFTIDEETGMTGALNLEGGMLEAKIMLKLDTEDDDELTIGCAGGVDITATSAYPTASVGDGNTAFSLSVKGLTGGHSGAEIHLGRGNANKIMNRILYTLNKEIGISVSSIDGGSLRNAIPRESKAVLLVAQKDVANAQPIFANLVADIKAEYAITDAHLMIEMNATTIPESIMDKDFQAKLFAALYACPNGIYRMSPAIEGLVQSSNNVARVLLQNGNYSIQCLTRSSVDSEKTDLGNAISAAFEMMNAENITFSGSYPGWEPRPDAPIIKIMSELYTELFGEKAHVNAVHAGLECGILGTNYPEMQMISFGPNIYGPHSPDERVQISSVQKFWKYFLETLKRIPKN